MCHFQFHLGPGISIQRHRRALAWRRGISRPQLNYARFSPSFRFHRTRAEQIGAGITLFPFHPVTLHFPFFFLPFFLNRPDIQFNLPHCASAEGEGDTAHEELTTWEGQREVERGGCQTHKREKLASNKVGRGRRRRPCLAGLITVSGEKEVSKQLSEKRLERSRRKEKLMERTEKRENRIVAGFALRSLSIGVGSFDGRSVAAVQLVIVMFVCGALSSSGPAGQRSEKASSSHPTR